MLNLLGVPLLVEIVVGEEVEEDRPLGLDLVLEVEEEVVVDREEDLITPGEGKECLVCPSPRSMVLQGTQSSELSSRTSVQGFRGR